MVSNKDTSSRVCNMIAAACAILAIAVSVRGCSQANEALRISKASAHLDVEAHLRMYIRGKAPVFDAVLYNDGPIDALNVVVTHRTFSIPRRTSGQRFAGVMVTGPSARRDYNPELAGLWAFIPVLKVKESRTESYSVQTEPEDSPWLRFDIFDITYYRQSDIRKCFKRVFFVCDRGATYNTESFAHHPSHDYAMRSISLILRNFETNQFFREARTTLSNGEMIINE
mgnify:CR=1 FL=1